MSSKSERALSYADGVHVADEGAWDGDRPYMLRMAGRARELAGITRTAVEVCQWCGSTAGVVHVHGHAQCASCGTNVQPCCEGS